MTVKDAALKMRLSIRRVQQFCADGRLGKWDKYARRYVIGSTELDKFRKLKRRPGNPDFCNNGK